MVVDSSSALCKVVIMAEMYRNRILLCWKTWERGYPWALLCKSLQDCTFQIFQVQGPICPIMFAGIRPHLFAYRAAKLCCRSFLSPECLIWLDDLGIRVIACDLTWLESLEDWLQCWQRQRDTCTMLFSWENMQGWPPLQRSSCSNGRILAEFLRMRPKSQTEEKQPRNDQNQNDQIKIQRVASICRLPLSTLKTTGTKLLKMLQSLQCKKVTQGYARHKWQRRKKANKQFRQKDYSFTLL